MSGFTCLTRKQVSGAIGQVALKNSKFNREGEIGGLHSARRLARKLFSVLSNVSPPRSHLIVEGMISHVELRYSQPDL